MKQRTRKILKRFVYALLGLTGAVTIFIIVVLAFGVTLNLSSFSSIIEDKVSAALNRNTRITGEILLKASLRPKPCLQ